MKQDKKAKESKKDNKPKLIENYFRLGELELSSSDPNLRLDSLASLALTLLKHRSVQRVLSICAIKKKIGVGIS